VDWKYITSTLEVYRWVYLLYTWKCTFVNLKCSNLVRRSIKLVYFLVHYKYMVRSILPILILKHIAKGKAFDNIDYGFQMINYVPYIPRCAMWGKANTRCYIFLADDTKWKLIKPCFLKTELVFNEMSHTINEEIMHSFA